MRVGVSIVATVLATASLALAESEWVLDPWASDPGTNLAGAASRTEAPSPTGVDTKGASTRSWLDERGPELESPWSNPKALSTPNGATPPNAAASERTPSVTQTAGVWARPMVEVIDPWAPAADAKASWVPNSNLIVDPWARDD